MFLPCCAALLLFSALVARRSTQGKGAAPAAAAPPLGLNLAALGLPLGAPALGAPSPIGLVQCRTLLCINRSYLGECRFGGDQHFFANMLRAARVCG